MSGTLTLEQVREAGRFAYHVEDDGVGLFDGYIWADGRLCWCSEEYGEFEVITRPDREVDDPRDGWRHLPGCECRFCAATGTPFFEQLHEVEDLAKRANRRAAP